MTYSGTLYLIGFNYNKLGSETLNLFRPLEKYSDHVAGSAQSLPTLDENADLILRHYSINIESLIFQNLVNKAYHCCSAHRDLKITSYFFYEAVLRSYIAAIRTTASVFYLNNGKSHKK